ncbi:MAG: bifunctional oligoribonuclease/PAP phosphatase NrnA, partial [Candidatus Paceibacterota bacterium]
MSDNRGFARISKILDENQSLAICLPVNHTIDGVAAATALYIGLAKLGKNPTLASSGIPSSTLNLKGVEKLQKELSSGGDNLVISFPYKEGVVDKITTNVEDNQFNLIIYPQKGSGKLDPSKVKYRFKGGSVDALFIIDVPTLQSLGELYTNNKDLFTGVDIINIDRHVTNKNFGSVNLVNKKISSLSELIFDLLIYLKVQIDKDIATNLYAGISAATNNFTS